MRTFLKVLIIAILSISTAEASNHKMQKPVKSIVKHVKATNVKHAIKVKSNVMKGVASVYHPKFQGRKTASGERYDSYKLTAAHRTLPLNSTIMVTNLNNGKHVQVRVNDRGPHIKGRILDMSNKAAATIALNGLAPVSYTVIR